MQDTSRYAVGIDVGTTKVRCVIGYIDVSTGTPTIVGVGETPNSGMRKGSVVNLQGPLKAVDTALNEAERMSGYHATGATVSINGSHLLSTKADGMIAIGTLDHEITEEDLARLDDVATTGKVPANRRILQVVPFSYRLDGQSDIKDPLGMTGTRLEINANVISSLAPHENNLHKVMEGLDMHVTRVVPSVVASARAVLTEQQLENGVAVIDFGGATTSIAIYEEGELQYMGVVPIGSNNITNDLAIGLKTDPAIAEIVKLEHASATVRAETKTITVKQEKQTYEFSSADVDEIVEARLEEIFESINTELKKAGKKGQLPNGVVIVGGGSKLKNLLEYAKEALGLAVRKGKPTGFGGVADQLEDPSFAAAVGLMFSDADNSTGDHASPKSFEGKKSVKKSAANTKSAVSKFLERFRM